MSNPFAAPRTYTLEVDVDALATDDSASVVIGIVPDAATVSAVTFTPVSEVDGGDGGPPSDLGGVSSNPAVNLGVWGTNFIAEKFTVGAADLTDVGGIKIYQVAGGGTGVFELGIASSIGANPNAVAWEIGPATVDSPNTAGFVSGDFDDPGTLTAGTDYYVVAKGVSGGDDYGAYSITYKSGAVTVDGGIASDENKMYWQTSNPASNWNSSNSQHVFWRLVGAALGTRSLEVLNKGGAGSGTTSIATLSLGAATAFDEASLELSGTAADLDATAGDVLAFTSTPGDTGLAAPNGLLRVTLDRR